MAQFFRQAPAKMLNKEIDWDTDTIIATLHSSAYVLNADTHAYVSSLTNELATGGGYTLGGVALTSRTVTYTVANSWANARANTTAYPLSRVVRPATGNGFLYRATTAGTTGASIPTFPTVVGATVVDGSVTWVCVGSGIIVIDAADISWASATFTGVRYIVLSDRTPATAAAQPLVGYVNFGSDQSAAGGAFTESWDVDGIFQIFIP